MALSRDTPSNAIRIESYHLCCSTWKQKTRQELPSSYWTRQGMRCRSWKRVHQFLQHFVRWRNCHVAASFSCFAHPLLPCLVPFPSHWYRLWGHFSGAKLLQGRSICLLLHLSLPVHKPEKRNREGQIKNKNSANTWTIFVKLELNSCDVFFSFFCLSFYAPVGTLAKSIPFHDSNSPSQGSLTTAPIGYVINIKDTPLIRPQTK